jgi:hypothetical protein
LISSEYIFRRISQAIKVVAVRNFFGLLDRTYYAFGLLDRNYYAFGLLDRTYYAFGL